MNTHNSGYSDRKVLDVLWSSRRDVGASEGMKGFG
jgi:hypothetical protein